MVSIGSGAALRRDQTAALGPETAVDERTRPGSSTIHTVRVIGASERIAADLFTDSEKNRRRITFGDVQRHLAQLAGHPHDCDCGRCPLAPQVSAQRVYAIASAWQRQVRLTRVRARR